jgi:hypothetical protein
MRKRQLRSWQRAELNLKSSSLGHLRCARDAESSAMEHGPRTPHRCARLAAGHARICPASVEIIFLPSVSAPSRLKSAGSPGPSSCTVSVPVCSDMSNRPGPPCFTALVTNSVASSATRPPDPSLPRDARTASRSPGLRSGLEIICFGGTPDRSRAQELRP